MAPPQWEPSKQGYESMFATNNLAHFLVSELLLPKIEEPSSRRCRRRRPHPSRHRDRPAVSRGDPMSQETAKAATQARIVILVRRLHHMCTSIDQGGAPPSHAMVAKRRQRSRKSPRGGRALTPPASPAALTQEYHELGTYAVTKAIDAFHARYLQEKYRGANIYACAVHPGVIETGLLAKNEGMGTFFPLAPHGDNLAWRRPYSSNLIKTNSRPTRYTRHAKPTLRCS